MKEIKHILNGRGFKIGTTLSLLLAMSTSLVGGSLALYQKTIDTGMESTATAKKFVFTAEGTNNFVTSVKIAPGDVVHFPIIVANNLSGSISEVDMQITFTISFTGDLSGFNHISCTNTLSPVTLTKNTVDSEEVTVDVKWFGTKALAIAGGVAESDLEASEILYNAADLAKQNKTGILTISATATQVIA